MILYSFPSFPPKSERRSVLFPPQFAEWIWLIASHDGLVETSVHNPNTIKRHLKLRSNRGNVKGPVVFICWLFKLCKILDPGSEKVKFITDSLSYTSKSIIVNVIIGVIGT